MALDCAGVCGGSTQEDACGVCGGKTKSVDKCHGSAAAAKHPVPPPPPPTRIGSKAPPPPPPPTRRSKAAQIINDVKKAAQRRGAAAPPPPPPPRGDSGANGDATTSNDIALAGSTVIDRNEPAEKDISLTDSPHLVKGVAIDNWDNEAVTTWLKRIGLPSEAISQFVEWDVDGSMLLELDDVRSLLVSACLGFLTAVPCSRRSHFAHVCFCNRLTSKTWE